MAHRLGLVFGQSPRSLMEDMSGAEFDDWCRFYSREPWGIEAFDILFANLCLTIVGCFESMFGKPRIRRLGDFRVFREQAEPMDTEDMRKRALAMVKAMGGVVIKELPSG